MAPEEVFVEGISKPSILVVEDNVVFADMAKSGLKNCNVSIANTLDEAIDLADSQKFDFIVSDVMFPSSKGSKETDNSKAMLEIALKKVIAIAFVTRGDHHGQITELIKTEKAQISIKCLDLQNIYESLVNIGKNNGQKTDFNCVTASHSKVMMAEAKDQSIWAHALDNLRNVSAKPNPISIAMKQVSGLFEGKMGFEMRKGAPTLALSRIRQ